MIFRKMGDGGYSNIYEVYGDDGNLFALKVGLMFMINDIGSDQPSSKYNIISFTILCMLSYILSIKKTYFVKRKNLNWHSNWSCPVPVTIDSLML